MANVNSQQITQDGVAPAYGAVNATDDLEVGDNVFLHVKNGGAAASVVTLETPGTVGGLAIADLTVSVPATGERFIGPLPAGLFRRSDTGRARAAYSITTSVTAALLKL